MKQTGRDSGSYLKRFHAIHSLLNALVLLPTSTNISESALSANLCRRGKEGREEPYRDRGRGQTLGHWSSKLRVPGTGKYFSLTDENKHSHGCSGKVPGPGS